MSNFDVFNETGGPVYGAEIDLEGVHSNEVTKTFPAHFNNMTATEYNNGTVFGGTRLTFTGYNFPGNSGYIIPTPTPVPNTNGHYCVNLPGCEHFGFSVVTQPTTTRFYWLGQNFQPVTTPLSIPMPTWTYVPAVGAAPAVVQAVLAPPPPPSLVQYPDAVWVKTYVTELPQPADLNQLISSDPANPDPAHPSVAPQLPSEVEAEWELLPGDIQLPEPDISLADTTQAVVRRYEFFKYTGGYDEVHLPTSAFTGGTPLPNELGDFISANMVAANLEPVPEPAAALSLLTGFAVTCGIRPRRPAEK